MSKLPWDREKKDVALATMLVLRLYQCHLQVSNNSCLTCLRLMFDMSHSCLRHCKFLQGSGDISNVCNGHETY